MDSELDLDKASNGDRKEHGLAVLVDFDGTVCDGDVLAGLFDRFASEGWQKVLRSWRAGEISSRECLQRGATITRVSRDEFAAYIEQFSLTPGFVHFAHTCQLYQIPIQVISDGFDYYISRLLSHHRLDWLPFCANHLIFTGDDTFRAEFPHFKRGCGLCGNCKYYHLRETAKKAQRVIFVGDGLSDRYVAMTADLVFARQGSYLDKLLAGLDLPYHRFEDFYEIGRVIFDRKLDGL